MRGGEREGVKKKWGEIREETRESEPLRQKPGNTGPNWQRPRLQRSQARASPPPPPQSRLRRHLPRRLAARQAPGEQHPAAPLGRACPRGGGRGEGARRCPDPKKPRPDVSLFLPHCRAVLPLRAGDAAPVWGRSKLHKSVPLRCGAGMLCAQRTLPAPRRARQRLHPGRARSRWALGAGPLPQRATRPGRRRSVAPRPPHLPAGRALAP